jgi:hypothetical protein
MLRTFSNIPTAIAALGLLLALLIACKSSGGGWLGPEDETVAAGELIVKANVELTKIKELYLKNEGDYETRGKRQELFDALESNDKEKVRKSTTEIIGLIDEGTEHGRNAVDLIQQARDMRINADFQEYLRLKEEALKKQLEAFAKYKQAAISLRDNYDPQNTGNRDRVKAIFEEQSKSYRELMEKARDNSSQANELYQEVQMRKSKK